MWKSLWLVCLAAACGQEGAPIQLADGPATATWAEEVSRRIGNEELRFEREGDGVYAGSNRQSDLRVRIDAEGALLTSRSGRRGSWRLRMKTRAVRRSRAVREGACDDALGPGATHDCLRPVELADDSTIESWRNLPQGIEQVFLFSERSIGSGPLRVEIALEGLTARIQSGAVILSDGGRDLVKGPVKNEGGQAQRYGESEAVIRARRGRATSAARAGSPRRRRAGTP